MANWTNFRALFPANEQDIVLNLETLFAEGFGIYNFDAFATLTPEEIQNKLELAVATETFVEEMADWIIARANAGGIGSWTEFEASFEPDNYPHIADLITWYDGNSTEFGEFQGLSTSEMADDLLLIGAQSDYWLSYANTLQAVRDTLSLEDFANSFATEDQSAVADFLNYLVSESLISKVTDLSQVQPGTLVGKIDSLGSTELFIARNAQILIDLMADLLSLNPPDDTLEAEYQSRVVEYYDRHDGMGLALNALVASLKSGSIISTVKDIAGMEAGTMAGHIALLGTGSRYLHGIAQWFLFRASQYLSSNSGIVNKDRYEVLVRFTQSSTGAATGGYTVKVIDKRYTYISPEIGNGITDARGLMRFAYEADPDGESGELDVLFEIYDSTETLVDDSGTLAYDPATGATMDVAIAIPAPADTNITINYLESEVGITIPSELDTYLTAESISSLEDIRLAGGLARSTDTAVQNNLAEAQKLDSHAQLELISADAEMNEFLIELGYTNLSKIADKSRAGFVTEVTGAAGSPYNQFDAARVWNSARQAYSYQMVNLMGHAGDLVSGAQSRLGVDPELAADLEAVFAAKCDCDECTSGVSPVAYLASLLDYAEKHVTIGDNPAVPTDPDTLQEMFHHPFCELPADCKSVTKVVCQVRVAVEVLQQHITPSVAYSKIRPYLNQAYALILNQIGTSLEELRTYAVNGGTSAEEEAALARRIGIDPSKLGFLYLTNTGTQPALTEATLDKIFGLQDSTRNPLSDGYTADDPNVFTYNWQLRNVYWSRNTDADGFIYVEFYAGTGPGTIKFYKSSPPSADDLIAEGTVSASDPYTVILSPKDDRGISGRLELTTNSFGSGGTVKLQAIPKLLAWRLARLREQWQEQEWPTSNTYFTASRTLPILEPDWMSPEDIRGVLDSSTTTTSQPMAARIWINRRNWLDDTIISGFATNMDTDLDAVFDTLETTLSYPLTISGSNTAKPWDFSSLPSGYTHTSHAELWGILRTKLATAADREIAVEFITDTMQLDIAGFERLSEIQQKAVADYTDEDTTDAVAIAAAIVKRTFYAHWISEEDAQSITLTPDIFWDSLIDPVEGEGAEPPAWEPFFASATTTPFIDPDHHTLLDLAGPVLGNSAHAERDARLADLKDREDLIFADHVNGYTDMLDTAYASGTPTYPSGYSDLPGILAGLNSLDSGIRATALTYVNEGLCLTEKEFRDMMVIVALEVASKPVSQDEYRTMSRLLATGWKRKDAYADWVTDETTIWGTPKPWMFYRHTIKPWSGTLEDRRKWLQGLDFHRKIPLVDPDMVVPGDIFNPEFNNNVNLDNPAYILWRTREDLINNATTGWLTGIAADTVANNIVNHIKTTTAELQELQQLTEEGVDVSIRLAQLSLNPVSLAFVVKMITASSPTQDELDEFHAIVLQVRKERQYGAWIAEERDAQIVIGPDMFVTAYRNHYDADVYLEEILKPWRSSRKARKAWDNRLESRIMQHDGLVNGHWGMVDSVESATLRTLRDILIMESGATGNNLAQKSRYLTELLLTDMEIQCCQPTTRVAAGIETLQRMFHGIRTGTLDEHPTMELDDWESFDQDWKWLGSYGSWRGLMFVYLYPENLLLPSLRPHQTSTFKSILEQIRNNPRLTPSMVCELLHQYEEYLSDISSLKLGSSTTTNVNISQGQCGNSTISPVPVTFMFAQGGGSGDVYWSSFSEDAPTNYAQSFWEPIPGLENVDHIVDSFVFQTKSNDRFLYIYTVAKPDPNGSYKLVANRMNLETYRWQSDLESLETEFNIWKWVIGKRKNERVAPIFSTIQYKSKSIVPEAGDYRPSEFLGRDLYNFGIRYNRLSPNGLTWENDDFERILIDWILDFELLDTIFIEKNPALGRTEAILFLTRMKKLDGSWGLFPIFQYADESKNPVRWVYPYDENGVVGMPYGFDPTQHAIDNKITIQQRDLLVNYVSGTPSASPPIVVGKLPEFLPIGSGTVIPGGISKKTGVVFTGKSGNDDQFTLGYRDGADNSRNLGFTIGWSGGSYTITNHSAAVFDSFDLRLIGPCFQMVGPAGAMNFIPQQFIAQSESNHNILLVSQQIGLATMTLSLAVQVSLTADTTPSATRGTELQGIFQDNSSYTLSNAVILANPNLVYLNEAYYSLPMMLAEELQKNKFYIEALDLFRLVYDYREALGDRKIYPGLRHEENLSNLMGNAFAWLDDPENPHTVASQRTNSYTRYTIFSLVRCLLDYADQEFTRDTAESVPRASMLYNQALELLQEEFFDGSDPACGEMLANIDVLVDDPAWRPVWERMKARIEKVNDHNLIIDLINGWATMPSYSGMAFDFANPGYTWEYKLAVLEDAFQQRLDARISLPNRLCNIVNQYSVGGWSVVQIPSGSAQTNRMVQGVSGGADSRFGQTMLSLNGGSAEYGGVTWLTQDANRDPAAPLPNGSAEGYNNGQEGALEELVNSFTVNYLYQSGVVDRPFVPFSNFYFCVPRNPVPMTLLLHAELNLHKIRNCRNIAGIRRSIEPYAAATDTSSGMPVIGAGGTISFPGAVSVPPTQYRYEVLLARARELVSHAQQLEGSLLSILEKRDAEYYSVMRARQDAKIARAGVRLQDLRIREAEGGVDLAVLTRDRSQLQVDGLQEMIGADLNGYEKAILQSYSTLKGLRERSAAVAYLSGKITLASQTASAVASATLAEKAGLAVGLVGLAYLSDLASMTQTGLQIASIGHETSISINSIYASLERRKQEWNFQKTLAQHDLLIGAQQIRLAQDRLRVVGQERQISQMQADHSQDTLDFLINKFTNYELYDWMSRVMEGVYAFFLHQATGMAKMAQQQLAFERQEAPAALIQDDYWAPPSDNVSFGGNEGDRVDRKGLTGSARLLQDVTRLDLHAFETKKRKLQITKTISLAQLDPGMFAEFRRTGTLTFRTPMEIFDRDYPGHYLRLIQKVRSTVIALVPPIEGIKARLATTGISRIVTGKDVFQTNIVARGSESVALSSPVNDSGMFELNYQANEMLNPFEGMGVDAIWEFRMDRASNPFDFSTIADVLLTMEYTALESEDYRQEVIRRLDPDREGELAFSFKYNFADQWYDLHNPDLTATPYEVEIELRERDFPVNLSDVRIRQVSVFLVADDDTDVTPVQIELLKQDVSSNLPSYAGGIATPNINGVASTRTGTTVSSSNTIYTGNAGPWYALFGLSPAGKWKLNLKPAGTNNVNTTLQNTLNTLFKEEKLQDIILIVTYQGTEPQRS